MSMVRTLGSVTITTSGTRVALASTQSAGGPGARYRSIRVEVDQSAAAGKVYVGDLNVSSSRYAACLTLTGQIAYYITGECLDPSRIYCDTDTSGTKVQVSVID